MAIDYTKIGWDTSKYVNPTNMNQMDDGIKAACDGVDEISANYIKASNSSRQTITNTSSDLAMALKGNSTSKTLLSFIGSNGTTFGHIGVNSSKKPIFNSGTAENEIALTDFALNRNKWWTNNDGQNVDDAPMGATFVYTSHGAPVTGTLLTAGGGNYSGSPGVSSDYRWQMIMPFSGSNGLYIRKHDGNYNTWSNWSEIALVEKTMARPTIYSIASGASQTITLAPNTIYLLMNTTNVSKIMRFIATNTYGFSSNDLMALQGFTITASGLNITIQNNTLYGMSVLLLTLS